MTAALLQKLSEIKDLKGLAENTVGELGKSLNADCCQILLANPLDPNSAVIYESYSQPDSPVPYSPGKEDKSSRLAVPLDINGRGFGTLSLSRNTPWLAEEIDSTRILAGKIGELIRQAQLNDIAQRDTFRETFLVEINNLMTYSLGVGDALFMVVNILGKALRCSRCLFVCTDDKSAGWKCYEYWQQDKVKSCNECHWPTNDSSLIAQALASAKPIRLYEGQAKSYLTPAQAELQFSNTRSSLALPLLAENNVYGCVIIQQCDYRRHWTVSEVDTVQNVADRVAEALAKLPEEKRIHKPIMQLHQRIVAAAKTSDSAITASLAHSLKGAFGQQSIPSARDTLTQLPAQNAPPTTISLKAAGPDTASETTTNKKKSGKKEIALTSQDSPPAAPSIVPVQRKGKAKDSAATEKVQADSSATEQISSAMDQFEQTDTATVDSLTQDSTAIETDPNTPVKEKPWGDLDAIPTPSAGAVVAGLGAAMLPKVKAQVKGSSSLLSASLHKQKAITDLASGSTAVGEIPTSETATEADKKAKDNAAPSPAPDIETIIETEAQAREKVEKVLSTKTEGKTISEYVFSVPNIDMRTLGRINGWVEAIEQKDRYLSPHAVQVAEYSCAIASAINLSDKEIENIKLAALVHDVGKLGISAAVLQKPDEELDDAELLTTMRHPIDGSELLESSADLAHLAPIVLAHHEEYGGNGYPGGLKGEEIPLAARILHLANSYHGMVSDTRYSKGMGAKEAQEKLKKGSGTQYDPTLVDAFLKHLNA